MNSLHDVFLEKLSDLYDAENQIVEALPKLIMEATNKDLKEALQKHLEESQNHIVRLDEISDKLDSDLKGKRSVIVETLLSEGEKSIKKQTDLSVRDAVLIAGAQKVEHFEIASYGTAAAWAKVMGHDETADLLGDMLDEEKGADEKLSKIAEGGIFTTGVNEEATDGEMESEDTV